jgi:hypothetical protein
LAAGGFASGGCVFAYSDKHAEAFGENNLVAAGVHIYRAAALTLFSFAV